MAAATTIQIISAAAAAVGAAGGIYSATKAGPKAQGQPQAPKDPTANVYKDRNAQNAIIGGDSTGTGSLLTSSGNVAGNTLLGQ
jgi:hypothetical protein